MCSSDLLEYQAMVEQAIIATRQYAKRQLTWLRGEDDLDSFGAEDSRVLEHVCRRLDVWLGKTRQGNKISL